METEGGMKERRERGAGRGKREEGWRRAEQREERRERGDRRREKRQAKGRIPAGLVIVFVSSGNGFEACPLWQLTCPK